MRKKVNSISFRQQLLNNQGYTNNFGIYVYPVNIRKYSVENLYISLWLQNELRRWKFFPLKLEILRVHDKLLTFRILILNKLYFRLSQFVFFFKNFFFFFTYKAGVLIKFRRLQKLLTLIQQGVVTYKDEEEDFKWHITLRMIQKIKKFRWFRYFHDLSLCVKNYRVIYKGYIFIVKFIFRFLACFSNKLLFFKECFNSLLFLKNFSQLNFFISRAKKTSLPEYTSVLRRIFYVFSPSFSLKTTKKLKSRIRKKFICWGEREFTAFLDKGHKTPPFFYRRLLNCSTFKSVVLKKNLKRGLKKDNFVSTIVRQNLRLIFFYFRSVFHNLFFNRAIRLKSYIENYARDVFKRDAQSKVFVMSYNFIKPFKDSASLLPIFKARFPEKDTILRKVTKQIFVSGGQLISKKVYSLLNLGNISLSLRSAVEGKMGFDASYAFKKFVYGITAQSSFQKKYLTLLRNNDLQNVQDTGYRRRLNRVVKIFLSNSSFMKKQNRLFNPFIELTSLLNRTGIKYDFLKFFGIKSKKFIFPKPTLRNLSKIGEVQKKIEFLAFLFCKLKALQIKYFFKMLPFSQVFLSHSIKPYNSYYVDIQQQFMKNHMYDAIQYFSGIYNLNLSYLMHLYPEQYVRTTDYFVKQKYTRVRFVRYKNLKRSLRYLLMGLYFGSAAIFNEAFCKVFARVAKRRQKNFLKFFEKKLSIILTDSLLNFTTAGFHIRIRGRNNNSTRRNTKWMRFGAPIKEQTISSKINYNFRSVRTTIGIFGVSLWVVYNSDDITYSRENKI